MNEIKKEMLLQIAREAKTDSERLDVTKACVEFLSEIESPVLRSAMITDLVRELDGDPLDWIGILK